MISSLNLIEDKINKVQIPIWMETTCTCTYQYIQFFDYSEDPEGG